MCCLSIPHKKIDHDDDDDDGVNYLIIFMLHSFIHNDS